MPARPALLLAGPAGRLRATVPVLLAQAADPTLQGVVDRTRNVIVALLVGLATLRLTIAGLQYLVAAGEPEQVEKAKKGVKAAAVGYGLAALAPPLVGLLKQIVGV
jgi:hypothetical protein